MKEFDHISVTKLPHSEVEIEGEISAEIFAHFRSHAVAKIKESATLPGFRKGMAPEALVVKTVGEAAILEEASELALSDIYPKIILEKELDAVGRPQITVMKLAPGNPFGFRIKSAVMPEVRLPDYKKIAAAVMLKPDETAVLNEEVEEFAKHMRRSAAAKEKGIEAAQALTEEDLPALTDESVKSLGQFENVEDFKKKTRAYLEGEKRQKAKEKKRVALSEEIIKDSRLDIPGIFVESELQKMLAQFRQDVTRLGMKAEDYLKEAKKTEEDLKKEWREEAEKRAKLQLILNEIAEKESLTPDQKDVEHEVSHILKEFKDADRERVAIYAESVLRNEKVFQFLEGREQDASQNS